MRDKYFTLPRGLIIGQFVERKFQLIKKHSACVERFRPGIRRWQQIFDLQQFPSLVLYASVAGGLFPSLALAEKVRDAIACDAKSHPVTWSIGISRRLASTSS